MWKKETGGQSLRGIWKCYAAGTEDGRRGHEPENAGSLWELEKVRK